MSLYSANNICYAVKTMNELKGANVLVGGLINNMRGIPREEELVNEFSEIIGIPVVANISRSPFIQQAEARKGTVVQHFPDSDVSKQFMEFAHQIMEPRGILPNPKDPKESIGVIMGLLRKYQVFQ